MKVERVSYDVITPSAARAIFEAILWKPAIRWRIHRIDILKPIQWTSVRRNELASVIPVGTIRSTMKAGHGQLAHYIEDDRQQRAGRFLKDVAYRLYATFDMVPKLAGPDDSNGKFCGMFERRVKQGQVFNQPYLGCREFSVKELLWQDPADIAVDLPITTDADLGWMLYDLDYSDPTNPMPRFFKASITQGVIEVPDWNSEEVRQ